MENLNKIMLGAACQKASWDLQKLSHLNEKGGKWVQHQGKL